MKRIAFLLAIALIFLANPAGAAKPPACSPEDLNCWLAELNSTDSGRLLHAIMALGELADPVAIDPLLKKLEHKDVYVATAAVHALVKIGNPAVLPLVQTAAGHADPQVRRYAAYALGKIGGDDAFAAVQAAARDDNKEVRAQAAKAFAVMNDKRALVPLFDMLRDRSATVRIAAAETLGAFADPVAVNHLIDYGLCDISAECARASTAALVAIGEPAVDPLVDAYAGKAVYFRERILVALGNIPYEPQSAAHQRAVKLLLWVLKLRSEPPETRAVAAYTLGSLQVADAAETLREVSAACQKSTDPAEQKLFAACQTALTKIAPAAPEKE